MNITPTIKLLEQCIDRLEALRDELPKCGIPEDYNDSLIEKGIAEIARLEQEVLDEEDERKDADSRADVRSREE